MGRRTPRTGGERPGVLRAGMAMAALAMLSLPLMVPAALAAGATGPTSQQAGISWFNPNPPQGQPANQPPAATVSGTQLITAQAFFEDGVTSWDVAIVPASGGTAVSTCHEDIDPAPPAGLLGGSPQYPKTAYIDCPWDTTQSKALTRHLSATSAQDAGAAADPQGWGPPPSQPSSNGPAANGAYFVEVTATGTYGCGLLLAKCQTATVSLYQNPNANPPTWQTVTVSNNPGAPTGVAASFDSGSNVATVTWNANPEPDISGYQVIETAPGGGGAQTSTVGGNATSWSQTLSRTGNYQFTVAAERPGALCPGNVCVSAGAPVQGGLYVAQITTPSTAGNPATPGAGPTMSIPGNPGPTAPGAPPSTTGAPGAPGTSTGTGGYHPSAGGHAGGHAGGSIARRGGGAGGATATTFGDGAEGPDPGFSPTLNYGSQDGTSSTTGQNGQVLPGGDGEGTPSLAGGPLKAPVPASTRAVLLPLAAGLALFVLAIQVTVISRRRPSTPTGSSGAGSGGAADAPGDDFGDWMGL